MMSRVVGFCLVTLAVVALVRDSRAYSYESVISEGCHESLSLDALRRARTTPAISKMAAPSKGSSYAGDDKVLILDVPFSLPSDMQDIETVALLIGVRDNDLKGRHGIDSQELSTVHGDPEGQREHCLRRPEHDGVEGSVLALKECKEYIRSQIVHAFTHGLGADGRPDVDKRTSVDVHLAMGGRRNIPLPVFYVYMGQGLHTLQDSFTHTFRRPVAGKDAATRTEVTVVLNWVEFAEERLEERRDGPAHMVALDQCDADDELRNKRRREALLASQQLFAAALNPELSIAEKETAVDEVLNAFMSHEGCGADGECEPSCTLSNRWCDAVENSLRPAPGCGCRVVGPVGSSGLLLLLAVGLTLGIRRRRAGGKVLLVLAVIGASMNAGPAQAQESDGPTADEPKAAAVDGGEAAAPKPAGQSAEPALADKKEVHTKSMPVCAPGRQLSCACPQGQVGIQRCLADASGFGSCEQCAANTPPGGTESKNKPVRDDETKPEKASEEGAPLPAFARAPFGAYATIGGSMDSLAVSGSLAARFRLSDRWRVGLDVEWNPWCSLESKRCRSGTLNIYATGIRRWSLDRKWVALRSTLHVGASVLTFDLLGAPSGSTGPYLGASLLGVEFSLNEKWLLVLEPADVALPAPHLTGAPLTYLQYRFTAGLQFGG